jgi:3'-phosphoadenosine 5'-phosphosulfate sulfotransferase (PAPS reductase)/FAD synthetase
VASLRSTCNTDAAADLLARAVTLDSGGALALGVLTELLVASEKFADAEPHARRLVEIIAETATTRITERGATRMDDQTSEASMELRKKEGYF